MPLGTHFATLSKAVAEGRSDLPIGWFVIDLGSRIKIARPDGTEACAFVGTGNAAKVGGEIVERRRKAGKLSGPFAESLADFRDRVLNLAIDRVAK